MNPCKWTHDLSPLERRFVTAMNDLEFGYFESVLIRDGALVLDPWPKAIRTIKLQSDYSPVRKGPQAEFALQDPVISCSSSCAKSAKVRFFVWTFAAGSRPPWRCGTGPVSKPRPESARG